MNFSQGKQPGQSKPEWQNSVNKHPTQLSSIAPLACCLCLLLSSPTIDQTPLKAKRQRNLSGESKEWSLQGALLGRETLQKMVCWAKPSDCSFQDPSMPRLPFTVVSQITKDRCVVTRVITILAGDWVITFPGISLAKIGFCFQFSLIQKACLSLVMWATCGVNSYERSPANTITIPSYCSLKRFLCLVLSPTHTHTHTHGHTHTHAHTEQGTCTQEFT